MEAVRGEAERLKRIADNANRKAARAEERFREERARILIIMAKLKELGIPT